ncbi:MAG: hypothetical protein Fur0022_02630 [Anaerolineales bacterium]
MVTKQLEIWESAAVDLVARFSPWLAPFPTAYLVGRATVIHLSWPGWVGVISAIIVESLGLATTATALELREWNAHKRKVDPQAPVWLAFGLVGLYFVTATGLTIALDIFPSLATYAPAIFPLLSLAGVTVLVLRRDHRRRVEAVKKDKEARKAVRQKGVKVSKIQKFDTLQAGKTIKKQRLLESLLAAYRETPGLSVTDAARQVGVTRQTVYNWLNELESDERIHRNGQGVEVVE